MSRDANEIAADYARAEKYEPTQAAVLKTFEEAAGKFSVWNSQESLTVTQEVVNVAIQSIDRGLFCLTEKNDNMYFYQAKPGDFIEFERNTNREG